MRADAHALSLLEQAPTGADPGLVQADDGQLYRVKVPGNQHGPTSLLAERIVGLAGEWLGAPVAPSRLIDVPEHIAASWALQSGGRPRAGLAHGSMMVSAQPVEQDALDHHRKDGNAARGPFYIGLWEWCIGEDEQFIYDAAGRMSMWSIDHGMWIGGGAQWDATYFADPTRYQPRWPHPVRDLSRSAFLQAAELLDTFTRGDALTVAQGVPLEWGFTDAELIAAADWLHARAPRVAARLRALSTGARKD